MHKNGSWRLQQTCDRNKVFLPQRNLFDFLSAPLCRYQCIIHTYYTLHRICVLCSLCAAKISLQTKKAFLGKLSKGRDSKTIVIAYCLGKETRRSCCEPACELAIEMREAVLFPPKNDLHHNLTLWFYCFQCLPILLSEEKYCSEKIFHESSFRQDPTTFNIDSAFKLHW